MGRVAMMQAGVDLMMVSVPVHLEAASEKAPDAVHHHCCCQGHQPPHLISSHHHCGFQLPFCHFPRLFDKRCSRTSQQAQEPLQEAKNTSSAPG